ncbi:uncharacterized protein BDV17DRAFT_291240 [Aspergillus undulatus]|uniref:uncharacterized protein n=1 Tax=Aspergillus undulatus TaxID=1810928 RepID=UPI003CCE1186
MSSSTWKVLHSAIQPPSTSELSDGFAIHAPLSTDLWETPSTPPVFNCPMIYKPMPLASFKRARVTVTADIQSLYAQGGLALIIHRSDGTRAWIKTAVEFMDGEQLVCTVGKDQWPDWSPGSMIPPRLAGQPVREVTIEIAREPTGLAVFETGAEARDGLKKRRMIRELAWVFAGDASDECYVGAYAAKPLGDEKDGDMVVRFRGLIVEGQ